MVDVDHHQPPRSFEAAACFRKSEPFSVRANPYRQRIMPVDFAAYLLSASPPGFDYFMRKEQSLQEQSTGVRPIMQRGMIHSHSYDDFDDVFHKGDHPPQKKEPPRGLHVSQSTTGLVQLKRKKSKESMGKKKVSFADELGMSLCSVRMMTEASDSPPRLRPEILANITRGASAGVTETPPLVLNFKQPASDYLSFRSKLERTSVSLENVILKDYNICGTIKVKNVSFEKSVKVRCTFDSWEHTTDIAASYVPCGVTGTPLDTFSFEISVPPNFDTRKKVQFCICYEANGQQYWDNNDGQNYEVVSEDWNKYDQRDSLSPPREPTIFALDFDRDWSEYSSWSYMDADVPYY